MKDETIIAYLNNELIQKEMDKVDTWINSSKKNKTYFNKVKFLWENSLFNYQDIPINPDRAWNRIQSAINHERIHPQRSISVTIKLLSRIAAIAIILISIGFLTTRVFRHTLSSGIEWVSTQTTTEKVDILLPDNSHVWLNSNSKITYPEKFKAKSREVILQGEAFFEVTKKIRKLFIIHADKSVIQVLETSFNVESYNALSQTIVTVVTGKVSLSDSTNLANKIILEPGYQGIHNPDDVEFLKKKNDNKNFLAWKTGVLFFENTALDDVCYRLSRHFNMSILLDGNELLRNKNLTVTFDNKDIEEILNILAITLDISYKRDTNIVTLSAN